ncbi:MAG: gamma-glutamylcyclotransferase [Flavobacteriaceae bacterium]
MKHLYPWENLEEFINQTSDKTLKLFGYGSLINLYSASLTLKDKNEHIPAVGYGFKRVFNYPMNDSAFSRYGQPPHEDEIAALNVISTTDPNQSINGIIKRITLSDIENLRKREIDYDLHEIRCIHWDTKKPIEATIFILVYPIKTMNIKPHPKYVDVCIEGAKSISQSFMQEFLDTTYLIDEKTTLNNSRYA